MSEAANLYAPPAARVEDVSLNSEAEAVRRAHIKHEASIRAVGLLYYLGGIVVTLAAFVSLVGLTDLQDQAMVLVLLVLGAAQLAAGWGVRALRTWGRVTGCVLSAIGLLGFPIGTLINAYFLYLFLSKKGRTIFSPAYQEVIAATPDVKYRTSAMVWVLLVLLVAALVLVAVAASTGGR
jgi:hypothetical protein